MTSLDRLRELAEAKEPRAALLDLFFLAPEEGVTQLFLIRHAQIEASDDMTVDRALTALGREQAEVLAEYLMRYELQALYSSPTLRAQQTAAPIAQRLGLSVEIVDALRDVRQLRRFDKPFREMVAEVAGADGVDAFIEDLRRRKSFDAMSPFV
jgi:broad specificity phosphatase PhoE